MKKILTMVLTAAIGLSTITPAVEAKVNNFQVSNVYFKAPNNINFTGNNLKIKVDCGLNLKPLNSKATVKTLNDITAKVDLASVNGKFSKLISGNLKKISLNYKSTNEINIPSNILKPGKNIVKLQCTYGYKAGKEAIYKKYISSVNVNFIKYNLPADMLIMDINEAKKQGKYVPYLDLQKITPTVHEAIDGKGIFGEVGRFYVEDKHMKYLYSTGKLPHYYSEDGKLNYICVPRDAYGGVRPIDEFIGLSNYNSKILSGSSLLWGLLLLEVGYDPARDQFYIVSTKVVEQDGGVTNYGKIKNEEHKKGEVFRYFVFPLCCKELK